MVDLNTIINVDKEQGISSFGVVKALKKLFDVKKVGHLGTLDPLASGVLPVFMGKATKLIFLFNGSDKEYRATLKLGQQTDTLDAEGKIITEAHIDHLTHEVIEQCLFHYKGKQRQQIPAFSAIKYKGVPAYRLAREGKPVLRKEKTIRIDSIRLESFQLPLVVIRVRCSSGTYMRSLADDIGQSLGVGAYLADLRRLAVGAYFNLENAHPLQTLSLFKKRADFSCCINPVDILNEFHTVFVNQEAQKRLSNGQSLPLETIQPSSSLTEKNLPLLTKAVDSKKTLVAIGQIAAHEKHCQFNPSKIFI